jgi:hypothetical protein
LLFATAGNQHRRGIGDNRSPNAVLLLLPRRQIAGGVRAIDVDLRWLNTVRISLRRITSAVNGDGYKVVSYRSTGDLIQYFTGKLPQRSLVVHIFPPAPRLIIRNRRSLR